MVFYSLFYLLLLCKHIECLVDISFLNYTKFILPTTYDSRKVWGKKCSNLMNIQDQKTCNNCYAISSLGSIIDRICINSDKLINFEMSLKNLLLECDECKYTSNECDGGYVEHVYNYWVTKGIKTDTVLLRGNFYYVVNSKFVNNIVNIMKLDLINYGPFTTTFTVYEDFFDYKNGIYEHKYGKELFNHSVEIVGYGNNHWIVKNSWGKNVGKDGFFLIKIGTNECNIESQFYGGL